MFLLPVGDADEVPPVCWIPPPVTGMFPFSPLPLAVSGPETAPSLFIYMQLSATEHGSSTYRRTGTSYWFFEGTHARGSHRSNRANPSSPRVPCEALARANAV